MTAVFNEQYVQNTWGFW